MHQARPINTDTPTTQHMYVSPPVRLTVAHAHAAHACLSCTPLMHAHAPTPFTPYPQHLQNVHTMCQDSDFEACLAGLAGWQGLYNHQQLAVALACTRVARRLPTGERAGFFLGDGPGTGKGRTNAAVALYLMLTRGVRRVLWVSNSPQMMRMAQQDFDSVQPSGSKPPIKVRQLKDLNSSSDGVCFMTYNTLARADNADRVRRWLQAAGPAGDGEGALIIWDECHVRQRRRGGDLRVQPSPPIFPQLSTPHLPHRSARSSPRTPGAMQAGTPWRSRSGCPRLAWCTAAPRAPVSQRICSTWCGWAPWASPAARP